MRFNSLVSAAFVAASAVASEIEITNVGAKTLANYTLTFEFDIVNNADNQSAHCNAEWDDNHRDLNAVCSSPLYNATIYFPNGYSGIQYWATFIGIMDRDHRFMATVETGSPRYTCGHSGTEGVLSACMTEPNLHLETVEV
ncbi:hypothetical protein CH63R_02073 [Colletotrichum higginsianum IMI 349063]|uniref:AA1-like domain-containing protein n=3 Tax=Colletotrichum higginsianum TaxID=80884 RepID=A0A1B7YMR6_COLHI|nr:hypothetical protein CH63R_02073 [Colletotrichum higginsianum IMI 349063]OBR13347.1 hypothetical protein CH63R_02073 [Colletotrichum higginsianum IMI 349063]TID01588.1 hypothetical protein CH35J_003583 [Colletotrichum higginsianum]GJC95977.1 hypothetical protein ColKHC_04803 [Colletotrichum higginsianum]